MPSTSLYITLIEWKSRMPQSQGDRGWSCDRLPRTLGNEGDRGVSSAFPTGKQNRYKITEFISNCG